MVIRGGLETVEGNLAWFDVAFQGAIGDFSWERPRHDLLVFHLWMAEKLRAGVAAMEAHEGIAELVVELTLDVFLVEFFRQGVVDVEKGNDILGNAGADVFG